MKKFSILLLSLLVLIPFYSMSVQAEETFYPDQTYLTHIGYYPNTLTYKGEGVIVAIIDEGVWHGHTDLSSKMWNNLYEIKNNGVDDDNNGYVDDYFGWNFVDDNFDASSKGSHGTAVAGIIAARENDWGILGIAPSVKIMSLTACDQYGCSDDDVIDAIYYAVNNGANIINLSLGGQGYVGFAAAYNSAIQYAYNNNVVVVASAGNGDPESSGSAGQNLTYAPVSPACNDAGGHNIVIGVGANIGVGAKAAWSNYGECVDVYAPGVDILTTTVPQYSGGYSHEYYNGTSFSAPMVAGAVALLMEKNPDLMNFELIDSVVTLSINGRLNIRDLLTKALPNIEIDNISKAIVYTGNEITITGEHFRSQRQLTLVGNSVSIGVNEQSIKINDAGSLTFTIPTNAPSGMYRVKFNSSASISPAFEIVSSGINPNSSPTNDSQNEPDIPSQISSDSGSDVSLLGGQYESKMHDQNLIDRLKGTILLQVEEHGEAWYVNPTDSRRYYMRNGEVAYEMMRSFGLGITDADVNLIPLVTDTTEMNDSTSACSSNSIARRLKGRILLQVEQHGEAWYIHPEKCRRIYMKDGAAAYTIMRFLGLGIINVDLSKMPSGSI